jgi:hypothetical protein
MSRVPKGEGEKEPIKLDAAASHLLEECRMVLPGIQALFGFQLIAVFNQGFADKLDPGQQQLHYAALVLVALAAAIIMAPAAIHRQTDPRAVTARFVWLSSWLVLTAMLPLALALCFDVYLIGCMVFDDASLSALVACALFIVLLALWVGLPQLERAGEARSSKLR